MTQIKKLQNIFFLISLSLIVFLGFFIRYKLFSSHFPLIYDECLLGTPFIGGKFSSFFFGLNNFTKIPPIWAVINKEILTIFHYSIPSFRILSFIFGGLSLILFPFLLNNLFKSKIAVLLGTFLFAINFYVIYYSGNFRPYSSDVFICILLLTLYKYISLKQISNIRTFLYTLITIFLMLYSFPCMFIIPAIIFAKSIEEKYFNKKTLFILSGVLFSCLYLYLIDIELYKFMNTYWNNVQVGFLKPSLESFKSITNDFFSYNYTVYDNKFYIKWFCLAGFVAFFTDKQNEKYLYLFITLFAILAALLQIFPIVERTSLYLIPVSIIFIVKIVDFPKVITKIPPPIWIYKILLFIKSIILTYLILLCLTEPMNYLYYNLKDIPHFMHYKDIQNQVYLFNKDKFIQFLQEYQPGEKILLTIELYYLLVFYNKYYKYNKDINYHIYPMFLWYSPEFKDEVNKFVVNILDEDKKQNKLYIWGTFSTLFIAPEPNFIEAELNKRNIKYKKDLYKNFYLFKTL